MAPGRLPNQLVLSTLSLAELVLGPVAGSTRQARDQRRDHLRRIELRTVLLDFDHRCAVAYGQVCAATVQIGRKVRGRRSVDLMIAASALAHELPLYTYNAADLRGLEGLIEIVDLS